MTKAERLRARAAECELHAQRATDPEVKRQFEQIAGQWRELAEIAEHGKR